MNNTLRDVVDGVALLGGTTTGLYGLAHDKELLMILGAGAMLGGIIDIIMRYGSGTSGPGPDDRPRKVLPIVEEKSTFRIIRGSKSKKRAA